MVRGVSILALLCFVMLVYPRTSNVCIAETVQIKSGPNYRKSVTITQAFLGNVYSNTTDRQSEHQYVYQLDLGILPPRTIRLRLNVTGYNPNVRKPIRVSAQFNKGTESWNVPFKMGEVTFNFVEKTLCLLEENDVHSTTDLQTQVEGNCTTCSDVNQQMNNLTDVVITISTSNSNTLSFSLKVFEFQHFSSVLNQNVEVTEVGASSPVFYYVNLNQATKDNLLQVKVTSNDSVCAMVSVQPFTCPVSDTEETIKKEGSFQTMLNVAAFTIERNKFSSGGAFIVFIVLQNDARCGNKTIPTLSRKKNFVYKISDGISQKKIYLETLGSAFILLLLGIFAVIATCCCSIYSDKKTQEFFQNVQLTGGTLETDGQQQQSGKSKFCGCCLPGRIGPHSGVYPIKTGPIVVKISQEERVETETDTLSRDHGSGRRHMRAERKIKLPKYVDQLSKKGADVDQKRLFKSMFQKSGLYMWLVLIMGIFYGIPAIQLVLNYQEKLLQSGDADMCYYNFLCSIPVLNVVDFNHIYSNIGYLFFGLLFLVLTAYKETQDKKLKQMLVRVPNQHDDEEYMQADQDHFGIPQHFGIFYAMGFALIFEGILSACYHVCPTNENFQFDTTFMYLIAVLCFMKIYQFRHPDVTSNAYKVFLGIALVMFLEVIGIFYEGDVFWTISLVAYFLTVVMLTSIIYHSGAWPFKMYTFVRIFWSFWSLITKWQFSSEYSRKRMVFIIFLDAANLGFLIYGGLEKPGISTYLLMIFISNLVIYTVYYTTLKIYHKEHIRPAPIVYAILCFLCWLPALYFYGDTQKSTDVTPAESRNLNKECVFLDMYDNHDIWHFFSAAGLFFSFLFLLTLDDGLFQTPTNKIIIF